VAEDRAATYSTRSKFSETQAISEEEQLRAHVAEMKAPDFLTQTA
jgi:hypothetical protein